MAATRTGGIRHLVARGVDGVLVRRPLPSFALLDQQLALLPVQTEA